MVRLYDYIYMILNLVSVKNAPPNQQPRYSVTRKNVNSGCMIGGLFLDLSKEFDTIRQGISCGLHTTYSIGPNYFNSSAINLW